MHLHHWKHALNHFSTMMQQAFSKQEYVVASLSRERYHAKASFWAGICAQKSMHLDDAKNYFETASKYPFLFYGQMALTRLKKPLVMQFAAQSRLKESKVIKTLVTILDQSNVRRNVGQNALMNALLDDLIDHFSSSQECWAFLDLLRQRFPSEAIYLARRLSAHRTRYVFPLAYPTCPLPRPFNDPALVWSIALGETCFCPSVVSSKGALGVMQIMPKEVPQYAKKAGLRCDLTRMKEFNYGMSLGIEELKEKLTRYQQKYILGIASYNAGSKKLEEWRSSLYPWEEKDALLRSCIWIERVPYEETRNYICKIVSFYNVYRWMQGEPLTTSDVTKLLEL
jgi:GH24 family phage-related lysozyme (muramidase)